MIKFIHARDINKPQIAFTFAYSFSEELQKIHCGVSICREKTYDRQIGNTIACINAKLFDILEFGITEPVNDKITAMKLFEKKLRGENGLIFKFVQEYYKKPIKLAPNGLTNILPYDIRQKLRFCNGIIPKTGMWFYEQKNVK